jgi:hypothetical protein
MISIYLSEGMFVEGGKIKIKKKLWRAKFGKSEKTYHHVHAGELRPDLHEDTDDSSVEHTRTEELKVRGVTSFRLDFDPLSDFVEFVSNKRTVRIAVAMSECEHCAGLLPTILGCQPARRFR